MANPDTECDQGERQVLSSGFNIVVPTRRGTDLDSSDGKKDAHIRLETLPMVGMRVVVDLFDSAIKDGNQAHLESHFYHWSDEGAEKATKFLQKKGFRVVVMLK
jgi:hypothetical protein